MPISGLVSVKSPFDTRQSIERLQTLIAARGMTLFATIDHAAGAAAVSMPLRPTTLLLFGHARGGTPLMQSQQLIGLDLPLKVLVWQDSSDDTWLSYIDPSWLAERYQLPAPVAATAAALTAALHSLVQATASISASASASASAPARD